MNSKPNYNYGSAARKLDYYDIDKKSQVHKKKNIKKVNKNIKKKINKRTVCVTSVIFLLALCIVYRYNVISEKNIITINLKEELIKQESNIASIMAANYKNINLLEVESYAKQKLGMQKPDKNQVVYIDTSTETNTRKSISKDFLNEFIEMIKQFINM